MDINTISMSEQEAKESYKSYVEAVKTRKEKYLEDLKKVYLALSQGKKVIDIFEAFKVTGVNEEGDPKLAISLADKREVRFRKESEGGGWFSEDNAWKEKVADVRLPTNTFPKWRTEKVENASWRRIKRPNITTNVPIVPAHLLPEGSLERYYLLWEVEEWKAQAIVKDPFLLRRVNANTFIVFAAWDLTPVEQTVMRGR
jgi:hypothetical protein